MRSSVRAALLAACVGGCNPTTPGPEAAPSPVGSLARAEPCPTEATPATTACATEGQRCSSRKARTRVGLPRRPAQAAETVTPPCCKP